MLVKQLEWKKGSRNGSYVSHGVGIMYAIDADHDFCVLAKCEGSSELKSAHNCVHDAKAAAQADYDARILSAIEPAHSRSYEPEFPTDGFPDNEPPKVVLRYVLDCVQKWAKDARIIGNARAGDIEIALFSALTNTSASDEAPVAKVVSKYGDPEAFGERDLVALVDLSTLKYNTPLYARPQSAAVRDGWQPIETAPKGEVTEDAGCRGASEWFLGRVAPKYAAFRPPYIVIRRRAWPQEDSWSCAGEADYVPAFFDAWAPISAALSSEGTNGHR